MNERIAPSAFLAVMDECFERGQQCIFVPSGRSMLPMLDGKEDKVVLSKKTGKLQRYDVAFYLRSPSGQPVLHRMIGFDRDGGYIFSGDGQYSYEYGVRDDQVLAVLSGYTHRGREHRVSDLSYRFYIRAMMLRKRLRRLASAAYHRFFRRRSDAD